MSTERKTQSEPPSSAMKAVAIVALLVAAGLGVVLFKTRASTAKTEETAAAQFQASSNQLAELRTKLALEQGTATQAASNLQHVIDRRTAGQLGHARQQRLQPGHVPAA